MGIRKTSLGLRVSGGFKRRWRTEAWENTLKLLLMSELDRLREQIGALDRTVLEALNERLGLVRRVNEHKQRAGSPLIDAEREAELLKELAAANPGPLSEGAVQALFAAVLDVMKQEVRGEPRSQAPSREQPPSPRSAPIGSLAVVGTGLLGSSVALAARRAGVADVTGWDAEGSTLAYGWSRCICCHRSGTRAGGDADQGGHEGR